MTRYWCAHFALLVGLALAPAALAEEAEDLAADAVFVGDGDLVDEAGNVKPALLEEVDARVEPAQFTSGIGSGVGASLGLTDRCGCQIFFGAEYLSVRAGFSDATAFLEESLPTVGSPEIIYRQHNFDYGDSYRLYGGYRVPDCGCDVTFAYTNIDTGGSFASGPQPADGSRLFTAPFEVVTFGADDEITGTASVEINNYDLGIARAIPLGSPLGVGCGCGVSACGCWCPAWDVVWTGGIRFADVGSQLAYASTINSSSTPGLERTGLSSVDFQGVGLRTGLIGRRYFGKQGIASLFVRGDFSLLLGDVEYVATGSNFTRHSITTTQVVPVTEMEAGGTVFLTNRASISAGYMLAVWHDLGHRAMYDFGATTVQLEGMDDANMMTLDGWFIRGEVAF
ncbi:MAG: Lpg1974 family pore-forming outer membrane protein [Planctomycetota bacterium]